MARLTRKNIKVFAENATNNGIFGSLQANDPTTTNDVEQIQSLPAWSNGWDDATMTSEELPPLEEFQGIQYVVSYEQAYLMQEGLPEWSTSVTYFKGSLIKNITPTGFQIYNSLTDNNTGNLLSDTSNWKLVMDSDNLYAFDSAVVHKTGNETVSGVKTFSSSPIVPDGSGSTDAVNKGQLDTKANTTDVVNLTGAQTISGVKSFLYDIEVGGRPESGEEGGQINFVPGSGETNQNIFYLDRNAGQFRFFGMDANGTMRVPLTVDINNNTVSVVASDVEGSAVSTVAKSKSSNGYFKLGNGLIIQWGWHNDSGSTLTFPTPFTSTNYSVTANYRKQSSSGSGVGHVNFYPTSTTSCYFNSQGGNFQWIAIGY